MRRGWFLGRAIHGSGVDDIGWFAPDGVEMDEESWGEGFAKSIAVFLNGRAIRLPSLRGENIADNSFLFLCNAYHEPLPFVLPGPEWGKQWIRVLDTGEGGFLEEEKTLSAGGEIPVQDRSLVLLMRKE